MKMRKTDLVAPCGDYCGGCGQYNGLIVETAKQMKEFANLYGFEFRSKESFDFKQFVKGLDWFIENAKCHSCKQGGGPPWCEVKKCCVEKGLRICFECKDFLCPKFKDYEDPDTMNRYKRFKEIGFEKWVNEQEQKANEGYEIHLQKVASLKPYRGQES